MLIGSLDGASTAHLSSDACHSLGSNVHECFLSKFNVLHWWIDTDTSASSQSVFHDILLSSFEKRWMVVAHADARKAGQDIKELVTVNVSYIVSDTVLHVEDHFHLKGTHKRGVLGIIFLRFRTRVGCPDQWFARLRRESCSCD